MRIERFINVIDFVNEVNNAFIKSPEELTETNIKAIMHLNKELIAAHTSNPAVGACIRALAERVSDLTGEKEDFPREWTEKANRMVLEPELVALVFKEIADTPENVKLLKNVSESSKAYYLIAAQIKMDRMNDYALSLNDVGVKDTENALAFVKKHGQYLRRLDFTGFQGRISKENLQAMIKDCPHLEHLILENIQLTSDELACVKNCKGLKTLVFKDCTELELLPLPDDARSLQVLKIVNCPELISLPPLNHCVHLEDLKIDDCSSLRSPPTLDGLIKLKTLSIDCWEFDDFPRLEMLQDLESLEITTGPEMNITSLNALSKLEHLTLQTSGTELPQIDKLVRLKTLELRASHVSDIFSLDHFPDLRSLKIQCHDLESFPVLDSLENLEELTISYCAKLEQLPSLDHLRRLKFLELSECSSLQQLPSMDQLQALDSLIVFNCGAIREVPSLNQLKHLRTLKIGSEGINKFPSLAQLEHLHNLQLIAWPQVEELPAFEGLHELKSLAIDATQSVGSIPSLDSLENLQTLRIHANGIKELPSLQKLSQLTSFALDCPNLEKIPPLDKLTNLQELSVDSGNMTDMPSLNRLVQLKQLEMSRCPQLASITSFEGLVALENLTISRCPQLVDFPPVTPLIKLRQLKISGCRKLIRPSVDGLENLHKFEFHR